MYGVYWLLYLFIFHTQETQKPPAEHKISAEAYEGILSITPLTIPTPKDQTEANKYLK